MKTASAKTLGWIERLIWILVYVGLFTLVLGLASMSSSPAAAWPLVVVGVSLATGGVVLIWVRSRMQPPG